MNRQGSSSSAQHMLEQEAAASEDYKVLPTTSIPIREEFRVRRLFFFYHDIRAFTTSWIPLPLFLIYRIIHFLYIFVWVIIHPVVRSEEFGPHWLLFFTNLAYIILVVAVGSVTTLCIVYTIFYYASRESLYKFFPKPDTPSRKIYAQDNIAWYMKIVWFLYLLGATLALTVTAGYYAVVFDFTCPEADSTDTMDAGSGNSTTDTDTTQSSTTPFCNNFLDVYSAHVHGINALLMIIDIFMSRMPYQILHFFYGLLFTLPYVIFTGIYFAADGLNHVGDPYIYSDLNYNEARAIGLAIVLVLIPIPFTIILFLIAWLRDVIYKRIRWCFRDVQSEKSANMSNRDSHLAVEEGVANQNDGKVTAL